MPKTSAASASTIVNADGRELTPAERLRVQADALYRAACECSHQQERAARLGAEPAVAAERKLSRQMCSLAATALGEMALAYERAAARFQPDKAEAWWRKANILWLAAREFQVHHEGCEEMSRQLDSHDAGMLGELHLEFELAASALLAMRQAAEGYRKARDGVA
jgi:hypothetical protein